MRFKEQGLQKEENVSKMFDGLLNTGDDHWNPSSGVSPSHSLGEGSTNYANEGEPDNDEEDDSDPDEVTAVLPTSGKGKKAADIDSKKGKKPKTSGGHWFQEQTEQMVALNERVVASCESVVKNEDKSGCSIRDVMALVKNYGPTSRTNEHFIVTLVFTKKAEREMFMTLDTPEERFDWLSRKHQWMTRNDVM
ncbi:hypothetical protein QOZ80_5AG0363780 [Eleusine coracana subsp. coracana]|nr:hypothetical protein QOZ80_5AG0363780 [Eleusine coracana subsp. coracana]